MLGLGNETSYSSPKQVGALTTWLNVAGGRYYTLATKTDGTLWSWGQNNYGQLGLGNTLDRSSPVQVGALTTWFRIACTTAKSRTSALKS
jgi:alpha-tubulin suppressor-like RCC1 family protein